MLSTLFKCHLQRKNVSLKLQKWSTQNRIMNSPKTFHSSLFPTWLGIIVWTRNTNWKATVNLSWKLAMLLMPWYCSLNKETEILIVMPNPLECSQRNCFNLSGPIYLKRLIPLWRHNRFVILQFVFLSCHNRLMLLFNCKPHYKLNCWSKLKRRLI